MYVCCKPSVPFASWVGTVPVDSRLTAWLRQQSRSRRVLATATTTTGTKVEIRGPTWTVENFGLCAQWARVAPVGTSCSPRRPRLNLGIYYRGLKVLPLPLADFSLAYLLCYVRFCFRFRFWVYFAIRTRRGNFAGFMRRSLRSCLRLDVLASMWVSFPVYQSCRGLEKLGKGKRGVTGRLARWQICGAFRALGNAVSVLRLQTHTHTRSHSDTQTLVGTLTAHLAFQMGCAPKSRQCGQVYKLHTHTHTHTLALGTTLAINLLSMSLWKLLRLGLLFCPSPLPSPFSLTSRAN